MSIIDNLTITSLETIDAFDLITDTYLFTLDELQNAKIANTQEKQDITGKQGRKLNSIKKNKAVVVSGTNGLVSNGLLAIQTGGEVTNKTDALVMYTDYIDITGTTTSFTLTHNAYGKDVSEGVKDYNIVDVIVKDDKGKQIKKFTKGTTTDGDKFTCTDGKTIGIAAVSDAASVVVHYYRSVTGQVLDNNSDKYSEKCKLYINAFAEDTCGKVYRIQFYIPKADFNGNFDFEMGDNQTVQAFEAESLSGSCGAAGKFWTWTVFDDDAQTDKVA